MKLGFTAAAVFFACALAAACGPSSPRPEEVDLRGQDAMIGSDEGRAVALREGQVFWTTQASTRAMPLEGRSWRELGEPAGRPACALIATAPGLYASCPTKSGGDYRDIVQLDPPRPSPIAHLDGSAVAITSHRIVWGSGNWVMAQPLGGGESTGLMLIPGEYVTTVAARDDDVFVVARSPEGGWTSVYRIRPRGPELLLRDSSVTAVRLAVGTEHLWIETTHALEGARHGQFYAAGRRSGSPELVTTSGLFADFAVLGDDAIYVTNAGTLYSSASGRSWMTREEQAFEVRTVSATSSGRSTWIHRFVAYDASIAAADGPDVILQLEHPHARSFVHLTLR